MAVGMALIVIAQLWAFVQIAPREEGMEIYDLFLPGRLWALSLKRLPETQWPVSLAAWGWTLIAFGALWIGGVNFGMRPSGRPVRHASSSVDRGVGRTLRDAAAMLTGGDAHNSLLNQALSDVKAKAEELAGAVIKPDLGNDLRETVQCVVLGYVSQADGTPVGVLLGTVRDGKVNYAGMVRQGMEQAQQLRQRLERLNRTTSDIRGQALKAVWVEPKVFCDVHHSGVDGQGMIREPNLKGLLGSP
jgi:hypothetical protein